MLSGILKVGCTGESLMYSVISSANRDSLISSFPTCIPLVSLSCLIAPASTLITILKRSEESGHCCLIPDFRRITSSLSPLRMMLVVGLSYVDPHLTWGGVIEAQSFT